MKSLMNGLLCASLLLAIACGKDGGGGSSSSSNQLKIPSGSTAAVTAVKNWYNGTVEGYPQLGVVNTSKRTSTYNTQPSCENKELFGIPYQLCTHNGSPSVSNEALQVMIVQSNQKIRNKSNPELQALINATSDLTKNVVEAIQVGQSQYQIKVLINGQVITYGINTQRNSALNPEFKSVSTQTQRIDVQIL